MSPRTHEPGSERKKKALFVSGAELCDLFLVFWPVLWSKQVSFGWLRVFTGLDIFFTCFHGFYMIKLYLFALMTGFFMVFSGCLVFEQ